MAHPFETLLSATPSNLAAAQRAALKEHLMSVLDKVRALAKAEKWDEIDLFNSPAGDGYRCDNDCIQFAWEPERANVDIGEMISRIKCLTPPK